MWGWLTSPFHFSWLPESTLTVNHTLLRWPAPPPRPTLTLAHTSTHHQRPRAKPWETRSRRLSVALRPVNTRARSNYFRSQGNSSAPSSLRRDLSKPRPPVCAIDLKCDNVSVEGNSSLAPADLFFKQTRFGARDLAKLSAARPTPSEPPRRIRTWLEFVCVCVSTRGKQHKFKTIVISGGLHRQRNSAEVVFFGFFCKSWDVWHITSRNKCQLSRPRPNLILPDISFLIVSPHGDTLRDPATAWQQLWRDLRHFLSSEKTHLEEKTNKPKPQVCVRVCF